MRPEQKWISVSIIILLILFVGYKYFYLSRRPILYPNFGISIPAGYKTHGIDVSHYQHEIDWELVSEMEDKGQRLSFAIVKATEGTNKMDRKFKLNWNQLADRKLLRGAYLYLHANKSGKMQADYFISKVKLQSGDLAPVIDIEETKRQSDTQIRKVVKDCAEVLEAHYKTKPIIYSNVDFYEKNLGEEFNAYPFWAAHYEQLHEPRISRDWLIWQHSCKGRVNGILSEVDFNVVNGSLNSLKNYCVE